MLIKCNKCGFEKESYEFSKNRSTKTGFSYWCKECSNLSKKTYYSENKVRIIEKSKDYYYENKEIVLTRVKKYVSDNKERVQSYQKRYTTANEAKLKGYSKNYRESNKERLNEDKKAYYLANKEKCINKAKEYREANKDVLNARKREYCKEYYKTLCKFDSQYKKNLLVYEEVGESLSGDLLVKCTYCGKFFIPTILSVRSRLQAINGEVRGEGRFYCSDHCKKACPIFYQVLYPKDFKETTSREVQAQLRQLVLKRDDYKCQICGKDQNEVELHCHHIEGVKQNPIESADVDNCITLCKEHHKFVHSQKGCTTYDLKCTEK